LTQARDLPHITVLGSTYRYLEDGGATGGAYSLVEETFFGDPPPLHVHDDAEEAFYVLGGSGAAVVDGQERPLTPGAYVVVPRGVPHTLRRDAEEPLRLLTVMSPAGFERFFLAVAATPGGEAALSEDDLVALAASYGCRFVEG
jgi:mannose-6-phosphate isomerase-like protein (cupin superfamily)